MTQRQGPGVFTTLLLLIPMLTVPVMALFGVPHFMPVVASPTVRSERDTFPGFRETRVSQSEAVLQPVSLRTTTETVDLFQPYADSVTTASPGQPRQSASQLEQYRNSWTDPLIATHIQNAIPHRTPPLRPQSHSDFQLNSSSTPSASAESSFTLSDSQQNPSGVHSRSGSRYERQSRSSGVPPVDPVETPPLSWRRAARLLEQLGVSTYSLSPGLNPGEFRFVCLVSSADNPRVSRRFESHAPDPLAAVEQVIDQVRNWTRPQSH